VSVLLIGALTVIWWFWNVRGKIMLMFLVEAAEKHHYSEAQN
jgi:hypothetical protein